jgi:predicted MFS family arabinose efflux permease
VVQELDLSGSTDGADRDGPSETTPVAGRDDRVEGPSDTVVRSRRLLPVYATHAYVHLTMSLFPAVLFALRAQWHEDYATLGGVYTAATMAYGFGALGVGLALGRVRALTFLRICVLGAAAAALAVAAAPTPIAFSAALFGLGISCSLYHSAGLTLVSTVGRNHPVLLGHHGMVGNIGLTAAPAFGGILAWLVSWRLPFAIAAGFGVVLALVLLAHPPADDGSPAAPADTSATPHSHGRTYVGALVYVFAITVALGFVFRGVVTFLPSYAGIRADFLPASPLARGGIVASLVYAVGFFGQWAGGHIGARRRPERLYAVLLAAQAALLLLTFFAWDWALLLLFMGFSFVHFTTQPMDNTFTGKYTSLGRRGVGYGVSFGLSFGIGSLAAVAGGLIADAAGGRLQFVFLMLAAVSSAAAIVAVMLARASRRIGESPTDRLAAGTGVGPTC